MNTQRFTPNMLSKFKNSLNSWISLWHFLSFYPSLGYCIWEEQVQLQVLIKLVDPHTKQVLGRTRSQTYPALGHAQALLSGDGEKFKQFVTQTGTELTADGLRYFRFLSK